MPTRTRLTDGRPNGDPVAPLGDVGALAVVGLALVVVIAVAAEALGVRPLASRGASALVMVLCVGVLFGLGLVMRRGRDGAMPRAGVPLRLLVAAPALVLVVYWLAGLFLPSWARVEWFLNGDHVRHLVLVADERAQGALSYAVRPYPRAWHSTLALIWSIEGTPGTRPDLTGLVGLMATGAWFLSGFLALATSTLATALGVKAGLRLPAAAIAGLIAGAVTLWPAFFGDFQALGMESSLVAALVIAVSAREVVTRSSTVVSVLVTGSGVAVMGHTWQLLLPVAGLLFVFTAIAFVRGGRVWHRTALIALVVVVGSLVILPSLRAVFVNVGVGHATDAGVVIPVPWLVLGVGLAASTWLAFRLSRDRMTLGVLALVWLPLLTGLGLAGRLGIPLTDYYPAKLVWHSALIGLPSAAVTGVLLWRRLDPTPFVPRVLGRAVLGTVAAVVALGAAYAPSAALRGTWSTVDGKVVMGLLGAPGAERAVVVWASGETANSTITRIMLDGYRSEATRHDTRQTRLSVEEDCELLASVEQPVVLTDRPEYEALARYSCEPDVAVVRP